MDLEGAAGNRGESTGWYGPSACQYFYKQIVSRYDGCNCFVSMFKIKGQPCHVCDDMSGSDVADAGPI